MKKNFKKILLIISSMTLFLMSSCVSDDINNYENTSKNKRIIRNVTFDEFSKNKKLIDKLRIIESELVNSENINGKLVSSNNGDFYIDTDISTYIEEQNGYHSYTFQVFSDSSDYFIENLVLSYSISSSTYETYLVQYDINEQEYQEIKSGTANSNIKNKIFLSKLDNNTINVATIFGRFTTPPPGNCPTCGCPSYYNGDIFDGFNDDGSVNWVPHICSGGGDGSGGDSSNGGGDSSGDGSGGDGNNGGAGALNDWGIGFGIPIDSEDNGNWGNNNQNVGGSGSGSGSSLVTTPVYVKQPWEKVLECLGPDLSSESLAWLQEVGNKRTAGQISNYLEANQCNEQARAFVEEAINDLINDECAILPKIIDPSQITAPYDPNLFGDYPAPAVQQDHDAIQQQFNILRNTQGDLAAVNYLINVYNMNTFGTSATITFNYSVSVANGLPNGDHGRAIIGYNSLGNLYSCELKIDTNLLSFNDFGYITRVIKHELYHVLQAENYGQFNVSNAAREFDAYYSQLFGFRNLKKINDIGIEEGIAKKICEYMDQMTESEKNESEQKINTFNFYFLRICNN